MTSRQPQSWYLTLLCFLSACNVILAAFPKVDFDRMGMVGLAGSFAGFDLFENSSFSFDPSTSTLLSRTVDGTLSPIAATNSGGRVTAGCAIGDTFFMGGSFSFIGNTATSNVASYTPSSGAFGSLVGGVDGEVDAMYCDQSGSNLWVGGAFHAPVSASGSGTYKGSVAVYNAKGNSWAPPPFAGLAGAAGRVQSITPNPSASSLYFAGSFLTAFQSSVPLPNGTNNPNVPFSIGATPFSSSLVPIPLTTAGTQIEALPSNTRPEFANISNALCPAGADGPGNTWLAQDGSTAQITVRTFQFSTASGLRLGNSFVEGRGTTAFSVLTIPDNQPLTFNYVDPVTLRNQTCSTLCPLGTDSSVLYQDFLFDGVPLSLTGIQITLSEWRGAGPGLHILQLLSSGAFASAVPSQNQPSCFSPGSSSATQSGNWETIEATTTIPGTTQPILVSTVNVGTPASSSPSITWMPYVSASGDYDINLLIPGCTNLQDCALRTSVKVTVSPGGGLPPVTTTVRQDVPSDMTTGIYRGPIFPAGPNFQTSIMMQLADQPTGSGQNGKFELVADRVQLVLTSVNTTGVTGSGINGTVNGEGVNRSFGFFEWNLSGQGNVDATGVIPNSTETSSDALGLQLFSALGNNTSSSVPFIVNAVAIHTSGIIFAGGNFTLSSGLANIVAFKGSSLTGLAGGGLNGPVNALSIIGNTLYVGGAFQDTPSGTGNGAFRGIVEYDIQNDKWGALLAGVNGAVTDINIAQDKVDIVGNFTQLPISPNSATGVTAVGFATWDIRNGTWVNTGGFLTGKMAFVANGTGSASEFLAGSVTSSQAFGASGFAMISNGNQANGTPTITPLNVQLDSTSVSTTATPQRRSSRRLFWLGSINFPRLFTRQTSTQPTPLPASPSTPAPAVLAGVFWQNTSSSAQTVILGGNFSFPSGSSIAQNVAFYDASNANVTGVRGAQVNGTVRALQVSNNTLVVGGEFTLSGTQGSGLAIYDLAEQQWDTSFQALQGSEVVVRSITVPPSKTNSLVVAGSFSTAGSLPCQGICEFDMTLKQWNQLGQGIQGEVSCVVYTSNPILLVAGGSIILSDGTPSNVASYSFSNNTWSAIGQGSQIPGPVTACEVDNGNASSIFAAGSSSDGTAPFLTFWNGATWTILGSTFRNATSVSQLTMVPLQDTHSSNEIIESDRMLLISGSLASDSFGNVSSALFDGQNYIPYLVSTSPSGGPGFVSQFFRSLATFSFNQRHFLPIGVVILISMAIATGIVFFLLLVGILWTLFSRRDHDGVSGKPDPAEFDDDSLHRPSSLLAHINAATRGTIIGAGIDSPFDQQKGDKVDQHANVGSPGSETFAGEHEQVPYIRATDTPIDAAPGTLQNEGEDMARPTHVRYSFEGEGEGELPLSAGAQVTVLDDRDPAWWYARDPTTGREGVIPASYLY